MNVAGTRSFGEELVPRTPPAENSSCVWLLATQYAVALIVLLQKPGGSLVTASGAQP